METKHLKKYAPEARREFIEAVTNKAAVYGLLPKEILPMQEEGDVVIIGDRPFPRSVAKQRKELEDRIRRDGFQQFIEAIAYTWFNRFVAIRYMELHGYLDHGYRVLSHPKDKSTPEILENAERIELPGLNRDEVVDLKLDGGKDEQLYQMLLLAQCNALHKAMPFLFESIKDGTELLLPDNLLHTDSLVRTLVNDIPEEQWENVEIIGWLYQFYISEKKDEVIGKVVKSEDIPAATQLFTPNWIVRYMLHNTLGRKWLATYPDSPLRQQMEFYIEPAEQTAEVQQQLDEITPDSLNPEELTLLDPACGSGHILVEAYDLFKAIYAERGYRARDIPHLILTKNLFGLEIDDRAAQLAAFALLMKARSDDKGAFNADIQPQVARFRQTDQLHKEDVLELLREAQASTSSPPPGHLFESEDNLFTRAAETATAELSQAGKVALALLPLFEAAKERGSLISIPDTVKSGLDALRDRVETISAENVDLFSALTAQLLPLVQQATFLSSRYTCVVTNPPYIGNNAMNGQLKAFIKTRFPDASTDTFAAFILQSLHLCEPNGFVGLVTPFVWMFLSSYESLRKSIFGEAAITSLIQLEYNAFEPACVPVCTFVLQDKRLQEYCGEYIKLSDFKGHETQAPRTLEAINTPDCGWRFRASEADLASIPGVPISFWLEPALLQSFRDGSPLSSLAEPKHGMTTGNVNEFVRKWWEVDLHNFGRGISDLETARKSGCRWFPYNKGGAFRKWYGNMESVLDYEDGGRRMQQGKDDGTNPGFRHDNNEYFFQPSLTWSDISSSFFGVRVSPPGFIFDNVGPSLFCKESLRLTLAGFLCSEVATLLMKGLNPTMHFLTGNVADLPLLSALFDAKDSIEAKVSTLVAIAQRDWDRREQSWEFLTHPLLDETYKQATIEDSWNALLDAIHDERRTTKTLERQLDDDINAVYGRTTKSSGDSSVTLHDYGMPDECQRLVSFAIGCAMGRFSLDQSGIVHADSDREVDNGMYSSFLVDADGLLPITPAPWFSDDAANRVVEFVAKAWPESQLEENLSFIAGHLGQKNGESAQAAIRRYLTTRFYKDHLAAYKKRPIYWLFSSGKQRAFQCLVYLHRYSASTLSRMRTEYVVKLQSKLTARIEQLETDIVSASSTSHRKKLEKERDTLLKHCEELREFDDKLRNYADQRIELDLNDGVKVNYGRFSDLLADVKTVTGKKPT